MSRRRILSIAAPMLAVLLAATACGGTTRGDEEDGPTGAEGTANPEAEYETGLSFAMLPKSVNNPYFDASSTGAEGAATALEGEYEYTGPSDASASSQVSYIDTLSQQATDVILLSANDPNALCSSLDQARSGGSVVVTLTPMWTRPAATSSSAR